MICWQQEIFAQRRPQIEIVGLDSSLVDTYFIDGQEDLMSITDTFGLFKRLEKLTDTLVHAGYYEASVDEMNYSDSVIIIKMHAGPLYRIRVVLIEAVSPVVKAEEIKFNTEDTISDFNQLDTIKHSILNHCTANGYPFASIKKIPVFVSPGIIDVRLITEPGARYTIGGAEIVGNLKLSKYYIEQIIGLNQERYYSPGMKAKVAGKLNNLSFADQVKDPVEIFVKDQVIYALFLNKKNINRFDLLIGFQPNTSTIPGVNQRLLITGNAVCELFNQFGRGERILAEYFQPRANQQQLNLEGEYPYLLSTPLGLQAGFKLFRSDSSFLETNANIAIQYFLSFENILKVYWNRTASNLTYIDTSLIKLRRKLPDNLDISTDFFGLSLELNQLDFKFNPRKGFWMQTNAGLGIRQLSKNDEIINLRDESDPGFNFESLYDTIQARAIVARPGLDIRVFIPIAKRLTTLTRINSAVILGQKNIYNNEKFRLGGSKTLRGWNEQSLFTTGYCILSNEFRFILDQLSVLYLFTDNGWLNTTSTKLHDYNWYMGIGAGMNFGTKAGVFGISLAVGRQKEIPFDFQAAKIHFGYQSLF